MTVDLVDLFRKLFFNPVETQKYLDNPSQYLHDAGVEDASYEELNEAATLAVSGPVSQGAVVNTGGASATAGDVNIGSSVASASGGSTATSGPTASGGSTA